MENITCAECGKKNIEIIVQPNKGFHSKKAEGIIIPLWRCKDCGFMFWDDIMAEIANKLITQALGD